MACTDGSREREVKCIACSLPGMPCDPSRNFVRSPEENLNVCHFYLKFSLYMCRALVFIGVRSCWITNVRCILRSKTSLPHIYRTTYQVSVHVIIFFTNNKHQISHENPSTKTNILFNAPIFLHPQNEATNTHNSNGHTQSPLSPRRLKPLPEQFLCVPLRGIESCKLHWYCCRN